MQAHVVSAALAGAATGLRSTVAMAALIDARAPGLIAPLTRPRARLAARVGVGAELVVDKLQSTPSRLEPRGLTARVAFAGAAGAVLARGADRPVLPSVLLAAGTALASARLGHAIRVRAAKRLPPLAVAVAGDALALTLARGAAAGTWRDGECSFRSRRPGRVEPEP